MANVSGARPFIENDTGPIVSAASLHVTTTDMSGSCAISFPKNKKVPDKTLSSFTTKIFRRIKKPFSMLYAQLVIALRQ